MWAKGFSGNPKGGPPHVMSARRKKFVDIMDKKAPLEHLIDLMIRLADGVLVEKLRKTKAGGVERIVYRIPPSEAAIRFLIEQHVGRASTPIEVAGYLDNQAPMTEEERKKKIAELKKKMLAKSSNPSVKGSH